MAFPAAAEVKKEMQTVGTFVMMRPNTCYSDESLSELEALSAKLPYEHVETGDADEPNFVEVGRFMTDLERPELVNRPLSDRAIELVSESKAFEFLKEVLDVPELTVRRMQVNKMKAGGFVGRHLDTDSNPDYEVAIVIQFGGQYEGGEYVVYGGGRPPRSFKTPYRSVTISDCHFPHEVKRVEDGERISLVFFLSCHAGGNRRDRTDN